MATHICLEATTLANGDYCHIGKQVTLTEEQINDPSFIRRFTLVGQALKKEIGPDEIKKLKKLQQKIIDEVTPDAELTEEDEEPEPGQDPVKHLSELVVFLRGKSNDQLEAFALERYGEDIVDKRKNPDKNIKAIIKAEKQKIAELEA